MADELAEINGIAPNVILEEGEEKEVGSSSRFVISFHDGKGLELRERERWQQIRV